ncbi:unnamed protein product [Brachionus calyciflorus]|uniref:Reverse transcriptase domain-containing protein n=1 Tax=Brachionus calyciflorus TaxID=104777 RepID=A0A814AVL9_9BILA|nr:unnamed protein product [Brachionus calyciflorus]
MSDPLALLDNWPSTGQGNHSDLTKRHHDWFKSLTAAIKSLQLNVDEQELTISRQQNEINQLKNAAKSSTSGPFSYSEVAGKNIQKTDAEIFILSRVHAELKEKSKIENNIIINGLPLATGQTNVEIEANDGNTIVLAQYQNFKGPSNKTCLLNPPTAKLSCFYTNATSLSNKFNELRVTVNQIHPDIIGITETWFNDKSVKNIDGYTHYSRERSTQSVGGGVIIYVKSSIESYEVTDLCLDNTNEVEQVWCKVVTGIDKILIVCIYRPPNSSRELSTKINNLIRKANHLVGSKFYTSLLIFGDFNYPKIQWTNQGDECLPRFVQNFEFLENLQDNFLHQMVLEPNYKKNILDLIITNDTNRIFSVNNGPPLCLQLPCGSTEKNILHSTLNWDFLISNQNILTNSKDVEHKRHEFKNMEIDGMYERFIQIYNMGVEQFVPKFGPKFGSHRLKWLNSNLKKLSREKYHLWNKVRASKANTQLKKEYNKLIKKLSKAVKKAKREFEYMIAKNSKKNPRLLFSYINRQAQCRDEIRCLIDQNGVPKTEKQEIVNILINQFSSVYKQRNSSEQVKKAVAFTDKNCQVSENIFNQDEILKKLRETDKSKAAGVDGLSPVILNECALSLSLPISLIFTKSYQSSKIPFAWSQANITPIFKKGKKDNPANYRPISLTSILSKIMEKIIKDVMTKFLFENNLVNSSQHGSVKYKSCITNLKQRVVLDGFKSDWIDVLSGVHQGSVIGPLLFIIFINDLPIVLSIICKLFADDSKLINVIRNIKDRVDSQQNINKILNWTTEWKLDLNLVKCKVMHIGNNVIHQNHSRIRNCFRDWDSRTFKTLYTSYVRPILEYGSVAWSPFRKQEIRRLEKVQRRATKLVPVLQNKSYEERLKILGITSLEERRTRGDLIQFFKKENSLNKINWFHPIIRTPNSNNSGPAGNTRRQIKYYRQLVKSCSLRNNFFTNRVITLWNNLPDEVKYVKSVSNFKNKYDEHMNQVHKE